LGDVADERVAVLVDRDDGRGGASTLCVRDDLGLAALQDRDDRVGGSEVDADCTCHGFTLLWTLLSRVGSCSAASLARCQERVNLNLTKPAFTTLNLCACGVIPGGGRFSSWPVRAGDWCPRSTAFVVRRI